MRKIVKTLVSLAVIGAFAAPVFVPATAMACGGEKPVSKPKPKPKPQNPNPA